MLLQCRVCQSEITAVPLEGVFVKPVAVGLVHLGLPFLWPFVLPLLLVGSILFLCWWPLKAAVFFASSRWSCPTCGARRWAWPRTGRLPSMP
jgi:hypothetical protein